MSELERRPSCMPAAIRFRKFLFTTLFFIAGAFVLGGPASACKYRRTACLSAKHSQRRQILPICFRNLIHLRRNRCGRYAQERVLALGVTASDFNGAFAGSRSMPPALASPAADIGFDLAPGESLVPGAVQTISPVVSADDGPTLHSLPNPISPPPKRPSREQIEDEGGATEELEK